MAKIKLHEVYGSNGNADSNGSSVYNFKQFSSQTLVGI